MCSSGVFYVKVEGVFTDFRRDKLCQYNFVCYLYSNRGRVVGGYVDGCSAFVE